MYNPSTREKEYPFIINITLDFAFTVQQPAAVLDPGVPDLAVSDFAALDPVVPEPAAVLESVTSAVAVVDQVASNSGTAPSIS